MGGKKRALFEEEEEDAGGEQTVSINESFAKQYEERKTRELLSNKAAYSLFAQEDGDEDESSEDEFAEELTPALDNQIQQTIEMIRKRDPQIYRKDFAPFQGLTTQGKSGEESKRSADKAKSKPVLYKDLIQEKLKRGELIDESESESEEEEKKAGPSYFEEQERLKEEFKKAAASASAEGEEEEDFVLEMKPASALSQHDLPPPISRKEEEFLFKYLSDRNQWNAPTSTNSAPTLLHAKTPLFVEDDEEELERAEEFEQEFVYRHMDPNATEIVSHGRKIEGSLRRKENSRKAKRDEAQERKRELEQSKKEELKRLKNLKRKLIEKELVAAFGAAGGKIVRDERTVLNRFGMEDLEEDFDPAAWDAKMNKVFDEEYYNEEDEEFERELEKEEEEDPSAGLIVEEEEAAEAAPEEEEEQQQQQVEPLTKKRLKEMVEERLEQEMEELGDAKAAEEDGGFKFHYREVEPNDYGLDELEVLQATNQELNAFVSLKRMAPYAEKEWFASAQHRKKFRDRLRARRAEAAQTTSKKEKERLRVAKHRFDKSKEATAQQKLGISGKAAAEKGISSARLKSFGA